MSAIYSQAWYDDLKRLIEGSAEFAARAPKERIAMALEVVGDAGSPYVPAGQERHYLIVLDGAKVTTLDLLPARHDGRDLGFRFTAPATVWESIAAGLLDPITAGLRGTIRVRGDMRFLMKNADAVKILVDLYAAQVETDWPAGKPPY
ncbi:MAG: SCP2 sterol-binding domain-containing protein [Polyangiaceae bacterium]|nr:SCP2 sterol-binding domain-containing protein [Polyangiaceae bacterium]